MKKIIFGEKPITISNIVAIAKKQANIELSQNADFINKISKGADFLDKTLEKDGVIYGVTTGYGDSCVYEIPKNLHKKLPIHLARFHGCGLGEYFDEETTRAILAVRLCSLSQGFSAVSFELLQYLELLLQNDILPLIPQEGSVGASGDLTPLSYIARTIIGEEKVLYQGEVYLSGDLFKKLKIKNFVLRPKEALALMNGTSVMTAIACLNYYHCDYLAKISSRITAFSCLNLKGNIAHFDELLFLTKPHLGQMQAAKWIREDLFAVKKSQNKSLRLQDRYSLRCAPHIIGVLVDILPTFKNMIEIEINSTNDNPVIDVEHEKIMHGGHFYGGHIAFVCDSLKNLVANIADMLDRQMALLVDEKFNNGLPANLSGDKSSEKFINHGLKALQIGVSAWTAEALKNTMPASVFSRSTECHNQDKVSMGTIAARDCARILQLTRQVTSALLIANLQALTIRLRENEIAKNDFSARLLLSYEEMMNYFDFIESDRPLENTLRIFIDKIKNQDFAVYE